MVVFTFSVYSSFKVQFYEHLSPPQRKCNPTIPAIANATYACTPIFVKVFVGRVGPRLVMNMPRGLAE